MLGEQVGFRFRVGQCRLGLNRQATGHIGDDSVALPTAHGKHMLAHGPMRVAPSTNSDNATLPHRLHSPSMVMALPVIVPPSS